MKYSKAEIESVIDNVVAFLDEAIAIMADLDNAKSNIHKLSIDKIKSALIMHAVIFAYKNIERMFYEIFSSKYTFKPNEGVFSLTRKSFLALGRKLNERTDFDNKKFCSIFTGILESNSWLATIGSINDARNRYSHSYDMHFALGVPLDSIKENLVIHKVGLIIYKFQQDFEKCFDKK